MGRAVTPAADHLFNVQDEKEARALEEEWALVFHHMVAQLLFISMRARQDIQTAVAFLTMRVKSPDKEDRLKLKKVLIYLNGTKCLKLKLSIDNLGMLKWYMDDLTMYAGTAKDTEERCLQWVRGQHQAI
jgi:hypothetical protein